jgi:hypothetical protein
LTGSRPIGPYLEELLDAQAKKLFESTGVPLGGSQIWDAARASLDTPSRIITFDNRSGLPMNAAHRLLGISLSIVGVVVLAATSATGSTDAAKPAAADTPPPIVEDFNYPGAAQILHDRGIILLTGDGHLLLADCPANPDNVIALQSRDKGRVCFKQNGLNGSLTMQIPNVYLAKGIAGHTVNVSTTTDAGVTKQTTLDAGNWTPVGEGAGGDATTVLKIDSSW